MIAAAFISLTVGHVFGIIGGALAFVLCLVLAFAALMDDRPEYGLISIGFAAFFLIGGCIVFPHMGTVDGRHHRQVFADLPREYGPGLVVVDNSVRDHWVEFRLRGCGGKTYQYKNMRLINGHYWFAVTVVKKDKSGKKYNDYAPISPAKLSGICATATQVA